MQWESESRAVSCWPSDSHPEVFPKGVRAQPEALLSTSVPQLPISAPLIGPDICSTTTEQDPCKAS